MSRFTAVAIALLAALGSATAAETPAATGAEGPASALVVTFVHPEAYTDASPSASYGADPRVLDAIRAHLQKLASRELPAGYSLDVRVLDVDLAGYVDWHYRSGDIRVIRDATWPRMTLSYVLRHGDDVVARAEKQHVNNMNFQSGVSLYASNDPLRYEKAMLDDWFEKVVSRR
ncbi:DUF3016 domain-containing protein [Cupriavidus sp. H19C3]|uniref:DUF3016 domain-containing protein n=1 Tax=Cupriavidus sp. H19C3 TaxID=3241603 RepID=UPI003BF8846C